MTYDPDWLVGMVVQSLSRTPATSLKTLARACGVSRHTLARAIKSETASSFRHLQCEYRRTKAETLLSGSPSLSIKATAYGLGFATPRSFTRWLKRTAGLTPMGLRRRLRERLDVAETSAQHPSPPRSATARGRR